MITFDDGISVPTAGALRKIQLADGIYVVGEGMSIPVATEAEAASVLDALQTRREQKGKAVMTTSEKTTKKATAKMAAKVAADKTAAKVPEAGGDAATAEEAVSGAARPAKKRERVERDLPVGTVLRRQFKGKEVLVTVVEGGFEYQDQVFKSITAVARRITGYGISGPVFFKLG